MRADAWDVPQVTAERPLAPQLPVVAKREAVRLVPYALKEVEGAVSSVESDRAGASR